MLAMTIASAIAIAAQKDNSKAISGRGSPNWLNGVKNSQKRNTMKNSKPANLKALGIIPGGQAAEIHL
jgi:hypothetical protein